MQLLVLERGINRNLVFHGLYGCKQALMAAVSRQETNYASILIDI